MSGGKLVAIAMREESRGPMIELEAAKVSAAHGVAADFRGKPGQRQVTVLSADQWKAACAELGQELPWTVRRANLLVEGIAFAETQHALLRVGDLVLQVTGETEPCQRMDEQAAGLCRALTPQWRGGVCCRIVSEGSIEVGDQVLLEMGDSLK